MSNKRVLELGDLKLYLLFTIPALILLSGVFLVSTIGGFGIEKFTADPAATANFHPLTGVVSNIGILLWALAGFSCVICFLSIYAATSERNTFLLSSGLLSLFLMTDDLFMLHEYILPYHLNIPQSVVYVGYLLIVGYYLFAYRKKLLSAHSWGFLVACMFLGASAAGDQVMPQEGIYYFIEDGLKFMGIIFWSAFFSSTSVRRLIEELTSE